MKSLRSLLLAAFTVAFMFALALVPSADAATNGTVRNGSFPLVGFMGAVPCASSAVQNPRFSKRVSFPAMSWSNPNDLWLLSVKMHGPQGGQFAVFLASEGQPQSPASPVAVVEQDTQDTPCAWEAVVPSTGVNVSYDELRECPHRRGYGVNATLLSVAALCANDPSHRACKYKDVVVGGDKVQDVTETTTCKRVSLASLPKAEPKEKTSAAASAPSLSAPLTLFALVSAAATSSMMMMSSVN
ncbi:hypothetical protein PINS_up005254 [Pythium insidiosum]|nr:hypothetical protein PINS_up005254 [Pythium insidiosum]